MAFINLGLQQVKLVPRQLGIEVLQSLRQLPVAARFARLPLERTDLPFDFAHQVGHPQQVLLGIFEFPQRLFLLRLVFGDARGLLKNHPPLLRFARKNLGDVALGQDAVAGPADAGAHKQLLDVSEPARRFVDKILAEPIAEDTPGKSDFAVGHLDSGGVQMLAVHPANGQRHLGHPQRLAAIGAAKNHIRHLAATQGLGRLLTQDPTNGI